MSLEFIIALLEIIGLNIVLSGDNAVVIAMAARALPDRQRKLAVIWGSAAAIVLRVALTLVAAKLLVLPWLKLTGAVLLLYVGVQLLAPKGPPTTHQAVTVRPAWPLPSAPSCLPIWS
jgi:predicted tellurium resistance membrane protein TerC